MFSKYFFCVFPTTRPQLCPFKNTLDQIKSFSFALENLPLFDVFTMCQLQVINDVNIRHFSISGNVCNHLLLRYGLHYLSK